MGSHLKRKSCKYVNYLFCLTPATRSLQRTYEEKKNGEEEEKEEKKEGEEGDQQQEKGKEKDQNKKKHDEEEKEVENVDEYKHRSRSEMCVNQLCKGKGRWSIRNF
ncbi:hypothetical protein E2C01_096263 [Portunus trituberculatus]|uniref:Uncharacterized protein n=1 Tax=Portunus trituberculatus TaxID=210409 RepID=A0A5B7K1K3_PORTR|nr:hypothetical protein [Portunus trituberculatus]